MSSTRLRFNLIIHFLIFGFDSDVYNVVTSSSSLINKDRRPFTKVFN